jgi:hypothetical protein
VLGNVIPFDKHFRLKRKLPGFGTPAFANAHAEAKAFMQIVDRNSAIPERDALTHTELTHVASKLLSPLAARMVRQIIRQRRDARDTPELEQ